jgi:uncharacterized protein (DUF58 family)
MFSYVSNLYLPSRFYWCLGALVVMFVGSFFLPALLLIPKVLFYTFLALVLIDYLFLFFGGKIPQASRQMSDRFSNGDENKVTLTITNTLPFAIHMHVIDELPIQLQQRNWVVDEFFETQQTKTIVYKIRPAERGTYEFGDIILYLNTRLGLVTRRCTVPASTTVAVYPSFMQLRKYQLLSQTTVQTEQGSKRMRKIGHSMEFEQIKEYVKGDDIRTINWKATARKNSMMVNNYSEERSQQVYCIIDKGRLMKMPFNQLSLLDYAINSTLVLSTVCLQKQDRIGLITFANKMGTVLPADRKPIQRQSLLQLLYNESTGFLESDYEMLYLQLRRQIKQRSLLVLFTNFESLTGMRRQLNYLRSIARHHLLMVVFFENTELTQMAAQKANNLEDVYAKTIAEKFNNEKKQIVKELQQVGILAVLTPPEKLTINAINKYLELKARQAG